MNSPFISVKYLAPVFVIVLLAGCAKKGDRHEEQVQQAKLSEQDLNGTFEYSEPIEDSYLYFKIKMTRSGDSVNGKLLGGIYLAQSVAGGYTNPTVLAECTMKGVIRDDVVEMQLTVTKTDRMEEDAPDLLGMMNFPEVDSEVTATLWGFTDEKGSLVSQNGLLMPDGKSPVKFVWEKIK